MQVTAELITPVAMNDGLRFAVREGGRTVCSFEMLLLVWCSLCPFLQVGAGVVTKVL